MRKGASTMEILGELIWFVAYVIQMTGLVAGFGLVGSIIAATLYELLRRRFSGSVESSPAASFGSAGSIS
jgi:hypothetical protein